MDPDPVEDLVLYGLLAIYNIVMLNLYKRDIAWSWFVGGLKTG